MTSWLDRFRPYLRTLLGVTPTLDLHGFGVADALRETEAFLRHAQAQGDPMVRIVYGNGTAPGAGAACCARSCRAGSRTRERNG